jgi:hypothetical protein
MIDSSSGSLQKEISNTIQDFKISGIPFMIDDRDWKVKKYFAFDMTHYLTDHNLGYDHKGACMQKHVHLRGISSIDT